MLHIKLTKFQPKIFTKIFNHLKNCFDKYPDLKKNP